MCLAGQTLRDNEIDIKGVISLCGFVSSKGYRSYVENEIRKWTFLRFNALRVCDDDRIEYQLHLSNSENELYVSAELEIEIAGILYGASATGSDIYSVVKKLLRRMKKRNQRLPRIGKGESGIQLQLAS